VDGGGSVAARLAQHCGQRRECRALRWQRGGCDLEREQQREAEAGPAATRGRGREMGENRRGVLESHDGFRLWTCRRSRPHGEEAAANGIAVRAATVRRGTEGRLTSSSTHERSGQVLH